jgi:hypothetical protein
MDWHPFRELLRMRGLKDAAGAIGEYGANSPATRRKMRLIRDVASTALRKEEMVACLYAIRVNSLKVGAM